MKVMRPWSSFFMAYTFSFLLLTEFLLIVFRLHLFVKIIVMTKIWKESYTVGRKSLFSAILQKTNGKIPIGFCQGNQSDDNFQAGLQKELINAMLYSSLKD